MPALFIFYFFVSNKLYNLGRYSVLQPVQPGSKVTSVIIMEIEVKGSTEPYQILLEPYAIVIPGEIFICTPTSRQFKVSF